MNMYQSFQVPKYLLHLHIHIQSMYSFLVTYGMALLTTVYRQNANIEQIYGYASERSERAWKIFAFSHSKTTISFNILLVLQIVCRYKNDMIVGLQVICQQIFICTNKTRKTIIGGTAPPPPPMLLFCVLSVAYNNVFSVGTFGGFAPQYPKANAGYATSGYPQMYGQKKIQPM